MVAWQLGHSLNRFSASFLCARSCPLRAGLWRRLGFVMVRWLPHRWRRKIRAPGIVVFLGRPWRKAFSSACSAKQEKEAQSPQTHAKHPIMSKRHNRHHRSCRIRHKQGHLTIKGRPKNVKHFWDSEEFPWRCWSKEFCGNVPIYKGSIHQARCLASSWVFGSAWECAWGFGFWWASWLLWALEPGLF